MEIGHSNGRVAMPFFMPNEREGGLNGKNDNQENQFPGLGYKLT
jgi:hypothetical protein